MAESSSLRAKRSTPATAPERRNREAEGPRRPLRTDGVFPPSAAAVLLLQGSAGNRAVSALFDADSAVNVQRYEAGEHAQFGARAGEKERVFTLNGVKISYGEMIAMGDFFESPDEVTKFANTDPKAFEHLVELIRKDRKAFEAQSASSVTGKEPPGAVSQKEWQDATDKLPKGSQYLDVTGRNITHFAGKNQETWIKFHRQALDQARQGPVDPALATNAFADHFLTDAFSAGHLFDKAAVMARAKKAVDKEIWAWTYSTDWTDKVAHGILADSAANAKLNKYKIKTAGWYDMNESSLSKVILGIYSDKTAQVQVLGLFANFVHNSLNAEITKGTGVTVKNKNGTEWKHGLSGDDTLASSPETLAIARDAVAQSRQNVIDAAALGPKGTLDYQSMVDKVWNYVPVATDKGEKTVAAAIATYTDPNNAATIKAFVDVSVENIDLTIDELKKRGYLKDKPPEPTPHTREVPERAAPERHEWRRVAPIR